MGKLTFGATGLSYQVERVTINTTGAPLCARCNDRVYFNEERRAHGKVWHVKCFDCAKCKKKLDTSTAASNEGEVYCQYCYKKEFGPKGYGFAGGAAGLAAEARSTSPVTRTSPRLSPQPEADGAAAAADKSPSSTLERDQCPRCFKRVYHAEEVKALGKKFHRLCFKCGNCSKIMEPGKCSSHEGEMYCNICYSRNFGPKGYGVGSLLDTIIPKVTVKDETMTASETTVRKQDPISRQQQELIDSRPHANGVYYGASNSIFDSRKEPVRKLSNSGQEKRNSQELRVSPAPQARASPLPQDEPKVVLVPHERTRFSPALDEQPQKSWSQEPSRSPVPDRTTPVQSNEAYREPNSYKEPLNNNYKDTISSDYREPTNKDYREPANNDYREPANNDYREPANNGYREPANNGYREPANNGYSANYSARTGSVEELSMYNDPPARFDDATRYEAVRSQRYSPAGAGPSPIDHLVSNMYTRSENQSAGFAYKPGDARVPESGDLQRQYHSVENLPMQQHYRSGSMDGLAPYQPPQHAKSASMDAISAYQGVGTDQAVAAALRAAHEEYGHVRAVPAYVNPTVPPSKQDYEYQQARYQPQGYQPQGYQPQGYQPQGYQPQGYQSGYQAEGYQAYQGPPQPEYGYQAKYEPQAQSYGKPVQGYPGLYEPSTVQTARSPGHMRASPYSYDDRSRPQEQKLSSAVDDIFSATMPSK